MKKLVLTLTALLAYGVMAGPIKEYLPIDHIYVPKGFDSNDNTEVIVSGYLPNLCYKSPRAEVKVVGKTIYVSMKSLKYQSSDDERVACAEMVVPFVEPVSVGLLDKGNYKVVVNNGTAFEAKSQLFISESVSNAVDEHVYAGVEYVEKNEGSRTVQLKGYNPSMCFELDKVEFVNNKSDTLSVLPKMKQVSDFCPMKMTPFSYEVTVPKQLDRETVLLHVRSMDGKSVNALFNNSVR